MRQNNDVIYVGSQITKHTPPRKINNRPVDGRHWSNESKLKIILKYEADRFS